MESKPMKFSELRERLLSIQRATPTVGAHVMIDELLADIDAAAPAMERQERDAKMWQKDLVKGFFEEEDPNDQPA